MWNAIFSISKKAQQRFLFEEHIWGGCKGLGGVARADAEWVPETLLSPLGDHRGEGEKRSKNSAQQCGKVFLLVPHLPLSHRTRQQNRKWGPQGHGCFYLCRAPPPVFCVAQHWVSDGLTRDTHTPLLSNNIPLSSPLPMDGVPCVCFVSRQRVSLSALPSPSASPSWKRQKKPQSLNSWGWV